MSKEPKKKPGDIAKARKVHLQNQARRDAIAKLRAGETIEVWAHYDNGSALVRVRPQIDDEPGWQHKVLCIFNRRLRVMVFTDHNGYRVVDSGRTAIIPFKQILGIVTKVLECKGTQEDNLRSARNSPPWNEYFKGE